jgi:serine/threonine protein kinase
VDDFGHAHIANISFATVAQNPDSVQSASGHRGYTARWAAPEVLEGERYCKEADVFAFAMVMIEVRNG